MDKSSVIHAQVENLFAQVPLIDGHNDFAYMIRGWFENNIGADDFSIDDMPIGQTDINRLKKGKLGGQFWSAFVPCPVEDQSEQRSLHDTIQQIDLLHLMFRRFPHVFGFVQEAAEILPTYKSGRLVSLIGVEGLHSIDQSFSVLRMFYKLGVRYATLCHNKANAFADSATSTAIHGGLSAKGAQIVTEMNRIGMIIDLSHTSHETQIDTLRLSKAPVIFSHSSCFTLCPNPRNVTDEVLSLLKTNNGMIMICFIPSLVASASPNDVNILQGPATVSSVADHIIYAGNLIGYAHIGIGSDFDGMLKGPEDLEDVSRYPNLVRELLQKGVSEEDVRLVMGLNIIRVLGEVEIVSKTAQDIEVWKESCDRIESPWTAQQRSLLIDSGKDRGLIKA